MRPLTVMLMGMCPPEGVREASVRPDEVTRKTLMSSLPALAANSQLPLLLSTSEPWLPKPLPAPLPPVATGSTGLRTPPAMRRYTITMLAAAAFDMV